MIRWDKIENKTALTIACQVFLNLPLSHLFLEDLEVRLNPKIIMIIIIIIIIIIMRGEGL